METKEQLQQTLSGVMAKLDVIDLYSAIKALNDDQFNALAYMYASDPDCGIAISKSKPHQVAGGAPDGNGIPSCPQGYSWSSQLGACVLDIG